MPVNVIDRPAFCDFAFGSIVNRSPLVIGISTDGAAPVFAPGDPRQARGADPARLRALGGGGAALAAARARRSACHSAAGAVLGAIHRARGGAAGQRAAEADSRLLDQMRGRRRRRARLGHAGRRRPGRSGIAHAAGGARAAIGRRDPVRRSGVAARCSISRGAKRRRCWSARPATARPASRTTSTR